MDMHALLPKDRPRLRPCCKYNKKPWMDGTLDTTYRGDFIGKEVPQERAAPKQSGMNLFGPTFDGTTTMGNDFKVWEVKREGPIRPTNTNMGNDLPFNGASTYKGDFGPKEAPYNLVKPKQKYEPNTAHMESETTHRRDFAQREVVPPPRAVVRGTNIPTNAGPFAGQSLYKDTYGKQPYAKREALVQNGSSDIMPHGAFDDKTMYGTSYVQKELARPEMVRPTDARPQTPQGWYGGAPSTEYRGQFLTKEGAAAEPIRMTRSMGVLPTGKFDGTTNNRADYVPFEVPGTKMIRPSPAFDQEKLPFNGQTTYAGAFIAKDVPYSRVRPKNGYEPNNAPFDGTTTQRSAYVPMEVRPNQRVGARQGNINTNAGPFEGQSTYKGDFTKMPGNKRDKIVPQQTQGQSGPFQGQTTYNNDFDLKEIPAQYRRKRDDECESCVDGIPGVTCIDL